MTYPPFCTTCRNKFEKIWFHQGVWNIRSEVKNEKHELSETINLKKCNILHKNWKFGFCFQLAKKKKKSRILNKLISEQKGTEAQKELKLFNEKLLPHIYLRKQNIIKTTKQQFPLYIAKIKRTNLIRIRYFFLTSYNKNNFS